MQETAKEKPYILLVDDRPHNLIALEAVLGTSEYHLVTATSGTEALALINVYDFAVILLDVHMPEMDGYEVARRLKSSAKSKDIPLFLVTAVYREDPYVQKAYEVGAVEYFSKPFNPDVLRLKVGIYSELYKKTIRLRASEQVQKSTEAQLKAMMESVTDAIYVGDHLGLTRCNSAACELFGLAADFASARYDVLADELQMRYANTREPIPKTDLPLAHALRGSRHEVHVLINQPSTGLERVIACAAVPVLEDNRVIGAVVVNSVLG